MARISTYDQDSTLNKADKVLGTDSATGSTKNYTIESILNVANENNLVEVFDGAAFEFQNYVDPSGEVNGVINLNASTASNASFSVINTLYISINDKSGNSLAEYLENADNDFIKISKTDNLNQFGIYEVTAIEDYGSNKYKKLTLTARGTNGTLTVGTKYFVANYSALYDQDFSDDSVTEFMDVSSAGSGEIITSQERINLQGLTANALVHGDVVNNLTSTTTDVPLSANQGKILKGLIDSINTLLTSDNVDLDTLQEVVDYIETNRTDLDALGISNITGLQAALNAKQNAEAGKGLSAEDFTSVLKNRLEAITDALYLNVKSNWSESNSSSLTFIENKPTDLTNLSIHSVTDFPDVNNAGSGDIITGAERTKLTGIETGAQVNVNADWDAGSGDAQILNKPTLAPSNAQQNVQSNWGESDASSDAFIQNKPDLTLKADKTTTIQVLGTTNEVEVSPSTAQDLSANRTITVGLPNDVTITSDLSANDVKPEKTIEFTGIESATPTFDNGIYYSTEDGHDTLHFRYHGHDLSIDRLTEILPTGILNGGELSKANSTQFTIQAGDGIINILNKTVGSDPHPEIKKIEWVTSTITVFNLDSNDTEQKNAWIYVNESGTISQQATPLTSAQKNSNILIGAAIHANGVVQFTRTFPRTAYNNVSQINEFVDLFGPLKKSGHKISANGTNLSIDRSAGIAFALGRNYSTDPENPSTISDSSKSVCSIHRYYYDGTSNHTKDTNAGAGYTVLDPGYYDDGDGTLAAVQSNKWSVQRFYYFPTSTNIVVAYYGKATYNDIATAESNYLLEDFQEADNTAEQAIYLGAVIVRGGATDLSNVGDAKFLTAGIFRSLAATNIGGVAANAQLGDLTDVNVTSPSNDQVLKYNSTTSLWENQADAGGIALTDLSVGAEATAAGDGDVAYDDTTGVFTYTPPDLSSYLTSAIDGSGTANKLAKFSDSDTLADSLVSEVTASSAVSLSKIIGVGTGFSTYSSSSPDGNGGQTTTVDCSSDPFGETLGDVTWIDLNFASLADADAFRAKYSIPSGSSGVDATSLASQTTFTFDFTNGASLVFTQPAGGIFQNNNSQITIGRRYQALPGQDGGNTLSYVSGSGSITTGSVLTAVSASTSSVSIDGNFGVGTTSPAVSLDIDATDAVAFPTGTTAQRPSSPAAGMFRYNTTDGKFEGYTTEWGEIGGAGGSGEIVKNTFSGTGSQAAFDITDTIVDIDHVNVYVDGVYQYPSNYTVSGSVVTFVTGSIPASGTDNVHIRHNVTATILTEGSAFSTSGNLSGDGATTTFALGGTPRSSDHTMVFLEGVYQEKENYSISGSDITFTTAPPNGYSIEVKFVTGILDFAQPLDFGEIELSELTGNGGTTYALASAPLSENYTNVYIEGVYQEKGTYSVSGSNIVFSSNVPTGYSIEVSIHKVIPKESVTQTSFVSDEFTANGSTTDFALVNGSPGSKSLTMVFIQGVYQNKSKYDLISNEIRFTAGTPDEDDIIEVISMSAINTVASPVTSVNGEVGAVTVLSKHSVSVISTSTTAVANTLYVLTANLDLTLPASPTAGDSIKISNRSNVATCQLLRNGNNILGAAADLTLDTVAASFELVYTDTANGWVIIGQ